MVEIFGTILLVALLLFVIVTIIKLPLKSYELSAYLHAFVILVLLNIAYWTAAAGDKVVKEYKDIRQNVEEKGITVNIRQDGTWKEENYNFGN